MLNKLLIIVTLLLFFSCGNEKILHLPEIQNAKITEVLDVSPAYIFYDETKQDSVELNRKNLIISTNWLVNVDKRLTLEQALPSIIKLQEKKRNASMHKNEKARNYYTCNDTSIKNLGFMDFTETVYVNQSENSDIIKAAIKKTPTIYLKFNVNDSIIAKSIYGGKITETKKYDNIDKINFNGFSDVILGFENKMKFQDYITNKSLISQNLPETLSITNTEFIY